MPRSALRILVAVQNPATEEALVRLAATLASLPGGQLHLTHVLRSNGTSEAERNRTLSRAAAVAKEIGAEAEPHLLRGENIPEVIKSAAMGWECNMMVMGWYGDVNRQAVLSSDNRSLAKSVDLDTLIFKDKSFRPARRIIVPTGGGSHSLMGLQVAADLAQAWSSELRVLRVARDRECRPRDPILERYCSQVYADTELRLKLLGIEADIDVVPSVDIVEPIIERTRKEDFLVLGASNDWRQEEFLAGSIPDEIAFESPCSVLMVRSRSTANNRLSGIFFENTVRLHLQTRDKWDAIGQMVDVLVEERQIPASERDQVLASALNRERKSSTAMGRETAIPHAAIDNLPSIIGALGICREGVDFEGADGEPVRYIFLLLTPRQNYRSYIPVLGQIASLMRGEEIREELLDCRTPAELTALLKRRESA